MDKKRNMQYWNGIDGLAEEYVRNLYRYSITNAHIDEDDMEDVIIDIGKQVTELATKLLEQELGAKFPYVDENY